jgi:hypothetical protein
MNSAGKNFTALEILYRDGTYVLEGELTLDQLAPYLELDNRFIAWMSESRT